jgi:malonate transporter and related proteins
MEGVLEGFGVAGTVVLLGFVLAHTGVVGVDSQELLSRLVFFVASPALLFVLLMRVDVASMLSMTLLVTGISAAASASLYALLSFRRWSDGPGLVIGSLCACYVNAGNLGLPIAIYALGDASAVLSAVLLQMLVLTPLTVAFFDHQMRDRTASLAMLGVLPLRSSITLAALSGIAVQLAGWQPPAMVLEPVDMLSGMAVPCMLLAYGVSLRLGGMTHARSPAPQLAVVVLLKLGVQPLIAFLVGRFGFGLDGAALMAVTVVGALPTGQNVFIFATRYRCAPGLARDSILLTTIVSLPVIVGIVALMA